MKNLKNNIITCFAATAMFFAFTFNSAAQETVAVQVQADTQKKTEFGIRFMPTFSDFRMQTSEGNTINGSVVMGYSFGAFVGYSFTKHLAAQLEVLYTSASRKYAEDNVDRKVTFQSIEIPLLASFNTGKFRTVNFNVVAGPQVGIRIGSTVYTSGGDGTEFHPILSVKKADIGLAYGAGFDFGLNHNRTLRLGLGFRGVAGLIRISDNGSEPDYGSYYIIGSTRVNTYSAYIGLSILL